MDNILVESRNLMGHTRALLTWMTCYYSQGYDRERDEVRRSGAPKYIRSSRWDHFCLVILLLGSKYRSRAFHSLYDKPRTAAHTKTWPSPEPGYMQKVTADMLQILVLPIWQKFETEEHMGRHQTIRISNFSSFVDPCNNE